MPKEHTCYSRLLKSHSSSDCNFRCKNHEASNYLWELYYGGWAAPNIYFLGYAVVVKVGNIRIGGLSGIYNARNYCLGSDTMKGHLIMTILSASLIMGTGYNLFATKNISKTRSSKELLEANLLLSCSKNSNHRISFQLTCSKSSLQLVFMRGRNSLPFRVFCDIEISFYIG
ncbi:hypothetical protein V6Z11_D02G279100 [Gossypium hirsutum]